MILFNYNEIVLNPRAYDNAAFEMISGTDNFVRQNTIHGGQPMVVYSISIIVVVVVVVVVVVAVVVVIVVAVV